MDGNNSKINSGQFWSYLFFICYTSVSISFMVFACISWINNMKSWCWRSHRFRFFSLISSCFRFNSRYGSFLPCRYSIASENIDLLFLGFSSPLFFLLNLIGSVLEFLLGFPLLYCRIPAAVAFPNSTFFHALHLYLYTLIHNTSLSRWVPQEARQSRSPLSLCH